MATSLSWNAYSTWPLQAGRWLWPALLLGVAGCNNANLDQLVDQGVQKVSQGVEGAKDSVQGITDKAQEVGSQVQQQVKDQVNQGLQQARDQVGQQTGQAGTIHLELDAAVDTDICHATLTTFSDGRPAVLQMLSYRDAGSETFPSIFLRAIAPSATLSGLAGQTVEAELFVQREKGGPIWYTAAPVQLQIATADAEKIVADLVGGSLQRTDSQEAHAVTGRLEGRLAP